MSGSRLTRSPTGGSFPAATIAANSGRSRNGRRLAAGVEAAASRMGIDVLLEVEGLRIEVVRAQQHDRVDDPARDVAERRLRDANGARREIALDDADREHVVEVDP